MYLDLHNGVIWMHLSENQMHVAWSYGQLRFPTAKSIARSSRKHIVKRQSTVCLLRRGVAFAKEQKLEYRHSQWQRQLHAAARGLIQHNVLLPHVRIGPVQK